MATDVQECFTLSCIRGYHVYQHDPFVGETLDCSREPTNIVDRYSVSVLRGDVVGGYLPKKVSKLCSLFLRRGGSISCDVTGRRRHSSDLIQGGLEIPCLLILKGEKRDGVEGHMINYSQDYIGTKNVLL